MSLAVSALTGLRAQEARYMWDFGVSLGMSGYTGDANEEFAFRRPGIHADLFGRYNFNSRWFQPGAGRGEQYQRQYLRHEQCTARRS